MTLSARSYAWSCLFLRGDSLALDRYSMALVCVQHHLAFFTMVENERGIECDVALGLTRPFFACPFFFFLYAV